MQKFIDAGGGMVRWIEKDPLLENIKDDEGFKKIINNLKKKIEDSRIKVENLAKES